MISTIVFLGVFGLVFNKFHPYSELASWINRTAQSSKLSNLLMCRNISSHVSNTVGTRHSNLSSIQDSFQIVIKQLYSLNFCRFDQSGQFGICDFAIVGENLEPFDKVLTLMPCLATQGSVPYLRHIPTIAQRWQGMMSVALFVPDVDFHLAILHIETMRKCYPDVLKNVTFHFVYPRRYPPRASLDPNTFDIYECEFWNIDMSNVEQFNSSRILYPQNMMRNVARKSCPTHHVLLTDIDMIPSWGMAPALMEFLAGEEPCPLCAYVIPAYEMCESEILPRNKSELLQLVEQNLACSFHKHYFNKNQEATDATRWENLPVGSTVYIGYPLPCFEFFYEPFYLVEDVVPPHDERFLGYGFTRNTQVFVTQLAGYLFFVLNNVFLVQHKAMLSGTSSATRKHQVDNNSKIYKVLKREFAEKYMKLNKLPCNFKM